MSQPSKEASLYYLRQTIDLAKQSLPKPTNFRVGCVIVNFSDVDAPQVLSTGFTLELPGNTHAEQCALSKLAAKHSLPEEAIPTCLPPQFNATLYTSLEPCGKRLSGNLPCVQRIIATQTDNPNGGIKKVVFGAKEPGTFVQDSQSCRLLTEAGIAWEYLPDFEQEILQVAMEGHVKDPKDVSASTKDELKSKEEKDKLNELSAKQQEQARAEAAPRNPKKRMMDTTLE
ncbi:hypothetical protein H2198_008217 [Neophaeococcomyces mojaviensis]|uniref:Uncharacterized protein n=1 Tax=Neophaeococcomyces mojaviensis TaxID=3383035 RepID=A0ACC2ZXT2_9EURO|nr:hypothetical protein H2198_008217 [Knufia sp. JES_112]